MLLLPLIVLVGFFFWQLVLKERGLVENQAVDAAQALSVVVDREVYGLQGAAEILSYSSILKTHQLDIFQSSAHEMARELKIRITLYDLEANPLVLSEPSLQKDLPLLTKNELQAASKISKPYITGITRAHDAADYYFTVVREVAVEGKPQYYLGLSMDVRRIADLLTLSGISEKWIVAVIDQDNHILARNKDSAAYAGRTAPLSLIENTKGLQGRWEGETLDGTDVLAFYSRSLLSDWRVVIGIKRSEFNQPLWNVLGYFVLLALGTILLSAILAGFFGRRIAAPVRRLAAQAKSIGGSQPVAALNSGIRELDIVSDALILADERRRKKEVSLLEAQLRLQMALDAGRVGVWEYNPETKELKLDGRTSQMLAFDGRLSADFTTDFLPSIHVEDRIRVEAALKRVLITGEIVRETFRICDEDHSNFVWVNGIGRRIYNDEGKPSVLGLIVNVTAEQMALEQREVVAQELNHRLKNMFAVIISLMSLSARGKTDVQDYVKQMRERMTALAGAFELTYKKGASVTEEGASIALNDLLAQLALPYAFSEQGRITIEGDMLPCAVAHVMPMSLVFHELVTNSLKHGALSVPQGRVNVFLSKNDDDMQIVWRETDGPEIAHEPSQRGFGSRLKQMSIEVQMQGSYTETWDKSGLVCIINLPLPHKMKQADS